MHSFLFVVLINPAPLLDKFFLEKSIGSDAFFVFSSSVGVVNVLGIRIGYYNLPNLANLII